MECERVREEFVERLTGTLDPARARAIDEHIAGCSACRAETDRLREMWLELGALAPAPAAAGAASRVERRIDARARTVGASTVGTTQAKGRASLFPRAALTTTAIAASLLVGVLAGRRSVIAPAAATDRQAATAQPGAAPAKQRYLLLVEGPAHARPAGVSATAPDSVVERAIVQEYGAWAGRLAQSGALVMAEKLADTPVAIHAASGLVTPARNPLEQVGGFFLIQVADSAEAYRIARDCPHLKYGGTVQVRRIQET